MVCAQYRAPAKHLGGWGAQTRPPAFQGVTQLAGKDYGVVFLRQQFERFKAEFRLAMGVPRRLHGAVGVAAQPQPEPVSGLDRRHVRRLAKPLFTAGGTANSVNAGRGLALLIAGDGGFAVDSHVLLVFHPGNIDKQIFVRVKAVMIDDPHSAFDGTRRIAAGTLADAATALHAAEAAGAAGPLLVFRHATGAVVDIDTRGSVADMLARAGISTPPARGRPKLGVTAREITLLPRHWEWLAAQPGGASVTLRKLVDAARRAGTGERRAARDAAYRIMVTLAGDLPGFEEASRALFADDAAQFVRLTAAWPADVRDLVQRLAFGGAA